MIRAEPDLRTVLFDQGGMESAAGISECDRYRYWLFRRWSSLGPLATFVMLNPSTADGTIDDPTIRRCIGFARRWNCGALLVVNLYALRATDPRELWKSADAIGPQNDNTLASLASPRLATSGPLVAAWGAHARPDRVARVMCLPGFAHAQCLGLTKAGTPRHPLYVRNDTPLRPFNYFVLDTPPGT